jgi:hypothetical protein
VASAELPPRLFGSEAFTRHLPTARGARLSRGV